MTQYLNHPIVSSIGYPEQKSNTVGMMPNCLMKHHPSVKFMLFGYAGKGRDHDCMDTGDSATQDAYRDR